jgi:hypothetical protein
MLQKILTCFTCGSPVLPSEAACPRCTAASNHGSDVQAVERRAVHTPRCFLTEEYVRLLEEAAVIHGGKDSAVYRAVTEKIRGSMIELRENIPAGYAALNSRVTFRVNGRMTLSRVLVHWHSFSVPGVELSLATPWGIALLGTRAGHEAAVYWRDGIAEMIRVERVEAPPRLQRNQDRLRGPPSAVRGFEAELVRGSSAPEQHVW